MDSLTQIVLGASVAEATLGKKVGNKAALWGAIAGTIPDLDVIGMYFLDTVDELHFHRGLTHSIVFSILFAPLLGWVIHKIHSKQSATIKDWTKMSFLAFITHSLLDCFTTWGTQLFWPLDYRVAWNSIFVIDPLYTIPFMLLLIASLFYNRESKTRFWFNTTGIIISSMYLGITLVNQSIMKNAFEKEAKLQNLPVLNIEVRPAPLQNILWTANLETQDGYYIGYRSFFDTTDSIDFLYFPANKSLLNDFKSNEKLQRLLFITKNWYTVNQKDSSHFTINDLRFGLVDGLEQSTNNFVFSYKMSVEPNRQLSFKQARYKFGKDVKGNVISQLWERIMGI